MIRSVLEKARKPSTNTLYTYNWKNFCNYTSSNGFQPSPVSLSDLLHYLKHLFDLGLSVSTLKVYISAIVAHQPRNCDAAKSSHPTLKLFLKGLSNLRPTVTSPLPQ